MFGTNILDERKSLRVLIVAPSMDLLGGQSIQAASLLRHLREHAQLQMGFLAINPTLKGFFGQLQKLTYIRTVVTSIAYICGLIVTVPKYDLIHIYSASYLSFLLAPAPAILIGKLFGKKLLLNYHSGEAEDHLRRWKRSALPIMKLVNEIVVPSEFLVRVFSKFNLTPRAIHNLEDSGRFKFRNRLPLRPVFISNRSFEWHYGVDKVLRAFSMIQKQIPEAKLIVAGDGPDRTQLLQLAEDLDLKNTKFTGRVGQEQMAALYDEADIFLNASTVDNQPLSILEAFNCGLPVVTTAPGAISDMVTHEQTGLLVSSDSEDELAQSALRLLMDENLANTIVNNAREECGKYTWEQVGHDWWQCYQAICNCEDVAFIDG